MSKIEMALAKARGRVVRLEPNERQAQGTAMVPARRFVDGQEIDRAAATKALVRMEEPSRLSEQALAERRIIHADMADAEVMSAFRELRTKILQSAQKNCTILVTSCSKDGDSAFVATNLAVSFSLDDSKTALLLDCNLGSPSLNHLLLSADALGITDYLKSNDVRLDQIIHPVGVPRLRVIPAGRSHDNVAEYFTSEKMRLLLNELRLRYPDRYLVLNAPPIAESTDARILADLSDYGILVVPYGQASEGEISDTAKMIGEKKLLGALFSDVPALPSERRSIKSWLAGLLGFGYGKKKKTK